MPDYLNFRDLIDGGGAGRAGPTFQGGGLLSMIANALATPYGSRNRDVGQPMSALRPMPMTRPQARPAPAGSGMTPANNYVGPPPMPQVSGPDIKAMFEQALRDQMLDAVVQRNPQMYGEYLKQFIRNGGRLPPLNNRPSSPVMRGF